ncbi:ribonuclease H-like protein [Trichoderma citrinoviride]|uniref:Ribonuclease H-like protein n=1 Tax=Trichoderma citrinoviride TaxID=58853 RepID=A0A2T4BF85_9HYPO|nr:ribonuclease H-like protein [Trichoderma citrinoviride]PTB67997.1 ribonuclease H-like protein [Trichoderma citrinoviride]
MSFNFNHTSQLWSSQLGVRFGALATLPTTTVASGLHTSALTGGEEGRADGPPHHVAVISGESITAAGTGTDALPSSGFGQPHIGLPGQSLAASLGASIAAPVAGAASGAGADADAGADAEARAVVEPPSTPLEFSISKEEFLAARAAVPGTSQSHWSHTMYHRAGENGAVDNVKVHYCESKATAERVCKEYFLNEDVLGFDLEWMQYASRTDGPRQNVSLIQIASPSRIALIHVALFPTEEGDLVGPSLRKILENPNVTKVGVNIGGDCTRLKNYLGVTVRGVFELSHLYKVVKYLPEKPYMVNKGLVSLATQVEDHLLLPLYKGHVVRTGNWMRRLNPQQIHYSASDAYAGLQLYYVLEEKRKAIVPCPPRPHHAELRLPIPLPEPPVVEAQAEGDAMTTDPSTTTPRDAAAPTSRRRPYKPRAPRRRAASLKASTSDVAASETAATGDAATEPSAAKPPFVDTRDARIIEAEVRMREYRSSKGTKLETTAVRLRAYYIWHRNEDLCPADIAALLRDPPLLTTTVASYVVDAIQAEKLPYPAIRLHKEVMSYIDLTKPYMYKYSTLVRECTEAVEKMMKEQQAEGQEKMGNGQQTEGAEGGDTT